MKKDFWDYFFSMIQSVGATATAGSLLYLIRQIKLQDKELKMRFDYQKREKALEMCKYYEELVPDIFEMSNLYEKSWEKLKINKKFKMKVFNKNEILENYTEKEVFRMINISEEIILDNFFIDKLGIKEYEQIYKIFKLRHYNGYSNDEIKKVNKEKQEKMKKENIELATLKIKLGKEYEQKQMMLLNKLEFFSMNFISGIAEESVVYQSLHQSFFTAISSFYPYICFLNLEGGKDKYYTNLIKLHNIWEERFEIKTKEEKELKEKLQNTEHSSKSEII